MTTLISWPLRIALSGAVATRQDDSDEYFAEELAQVIRTRRGERELVPLYGTADEAFGLLTFEELAAQVALFGPPVALVAVTTRALSDVKSDVKVEFRNAGFAGQVAAGRPRRSV